MISIWIVQLRNGDGVVLERADVPVADGAREVRLDPIELFGGDAPGSDRRLHVRRPDGTEAEYPCDMARPIHFHYFDPSMLRAQTRALGD